MGIPVVTGATIQCTMGMAPGTLTATAQSKVQLGGAPAATVADAAPLVNLGACGMCTSPANPAVAAATAAALGVLTPQPCVPSPVGNWICTGKTPSVGGQPGLASDGTLVCAYGGTICVLAPGQGKVQY